MEFLFALIIVGLVAAFVLVPFWRQTEDGRADTVPTADPVMADLEARKQAKYREIRDTELDHAQGKLGDTEFRRQEAELRAEAIAILEEIDAQEGEGSGDADD